MQTVTAAIIRKNGLFLMAKRKQDDTMGGYWEFPGGGVEGGETPDQCIVRELKEELGVTARPLELFDASICGDGKLVVLFYFCEIDGDPFPLACDELRWVKGKDLRSLKLLPGDEVIADRLASIGQEPTAR